MNFFEKIGLKKTNQTESQKKDGGMENKINSNKQAKPWDNPTKEQLEYDKMEAGIRQ